MYQVSQPQNSKNIKLVRPATNTSGHASAAQTYLDAYHYQQKPTPGTTNLLGTSENTPDPIQMYTSARSPQPVSDDQKQLLVSKRGDNNQTANIIVKLNS